LSEQAIEWTGRIGADGRVGHAANDVDRSSTAIARTPRRRRGGELVEIRSETGRAFRLTPAPVRPRPPVTGVPKAGSCEGLFVVPADFKEPLEEMREYLE
jgi:hypothetical protein